MTQIIFHEEDGGVLPMASVRRRRYSLSRALKQLLHSNGLGVTSCEISHGLRRTQREHLLRRALLRCPQAKRVRYLMHIFSWGLFCFFFLLSPDQAVVILLFSSLCRSIFLSLVEIRVFVCFYKKKKKKKEKESTSWGFWQR